jgi:hypothetical protein
LFGKGTYFTPHLSKADIYTDKNKGQPETKKTAIRRVIVSRVLIGDPHITKVACQKFTKPLDDTRGKPLDSIIGLDRASGGCVDYVEVVTFREGQALPMYVVEYSH